MKGLTYGYIQKMIENYAAKKVALIEEVVDEENIAFYLENVIKRSDLEPSSIHGLIITRTFDMDVFSYTVRKDNSISTNMLVTKNDKKIISIEEKSEKSSSINNYDSVFCIYNSKDNKIEEKMRFQKLEICGTIVNKIIILSRIPGSGPIEYDRKQYKIYMYNDEILYAKSKNDYYYNDGACEDFMIDCAVKDVETVSKSILTKFNDILHNEQVKEYKIKKRKTRTLMKVSKK